MQRQSRTRSSTRRSPSAPTSCRRTSRHRSRSCENSGGGQNDIKQLELIASAPDPTLREATKATPQADPVEPQQLISIAAGLIAGLIIGIGGAFAFQALDPRLRREEQLRATFRLPILARVPKESGARGKRPLSPRQLSPGAVEAYRALRATLVASRPESQRLALRPRHQRVRLGGQDDHGDQPCRVACARRLAR